MLIQEHGFAFPTVHLEMDFLRPLRYGDRVGVEVEVEKLGTSSVTWCYRLYRPGESEPAAVGRQVTVATDMSTFEKLDLPAWLRDKLTV